MQSASRLKDETARIAAREFTPAELCQYAQEEFDKGNHNLEALYLDALSLHARKVGWVELLLLSLFDWKEESDRADDTSSGARVHP